jgi:hypothetical protein
MSTEKNLGIVGDECSTGIRSGGRRWTDLGVVILSLLLAACVATIIYMAVQPSSAKIPECQNQRAATSTTTVNVKVDRDGETVSEQLSYDEGRNVALYYDENGGFVAEDFDKGLVVTRLTGTNECLVVPTGTSVSRDQVNSVMTSYTNGSVIHEEKTKTVYAQLLPGYIQDRSMFADEINEVCTGGYRWLVAVEQDGEDTFETNVREKRQTTTCSAWHQCVAYVRVSYTDSLFRTVSYRYAVCLEYCFDSDCTLYEEYCT